MSSARRSACEKETVFDIFLYLFSKESYGDIIFVIHVNFLDPRGRYGDGDRCGM